MGIRRWRIEAESFFPSRGFRPTGAPLSSAAGCAARRWIALPALLMFSAVAGANTITVNSMADVAADDGQCTLREAIIAANTNAVSGVSAGECAAGSLGADRIEFHIPGVGVRTITPASPLPAITEQVTIDGSTQPGSSPNTNAFPAALNTVLMIELDNSNSSLTINAAITTVRGLAINRGIDNIVINADDAVIVGNFIGTNPAGTVALPNAGGGFGIRINGARHRADIGYSGGAFPADRNLISGGPQGGIIGSGGTSPDGSPDAIVLGNFIGTDTSGTVSLGQPGAVGVTIANASVIGNLVSGNPGGGIDVMPPGNVIIQGTDSANQGNRIGTQRDGTSPLANGGFGGVALRGDNCLVGGESGVGHGNIIAFNNGYGVDVLPGTTGNEITSNAIFANTLLGVSLTDSAAPLPNDNCDADTLPGNHGQNSPVITMVNMNSGFATFIGTLGSTANTTFRIEFFANASCDPSGSGEGQTFLGTATMTTDGTCSGTFVSSPLPFPGGQPTFTATAIDVSTDPSHRNTSEFSACFPPAGSRFFTLTPCRVIDTRNAVGPYGGPALSSPSTRDFTLAGQCGIPASAAAVAVNIAVTQPTNGPGFLTLFPAGSPRPLFSSINYNAGQTRANNAVIPVNASGAISVFCTQGGGTVHLVLDVNGYFQ